MNQSPSGVPVTQIPHNKYLGVRRCKRTGSKEIRMANLCCGRQRRGVDAGGSRPGQTIWGAAIIQPTHTPSSAGLSGLEERTLRRFAVPIQAMDRPPSR
ncbi:hypothetical protein VTJ04DRAFT_6302 [Mycothermus thermophilus]|uniref:uncharacterized protein n=1 Tax=Humicola insolens TaxID=85995 RepID=UPI0037430927